MQSIALGVELDKDKINGIIGRVSDNASYLDEAVDKIVSQYTKYMDQLVKEIQDAMLNFNTPMSLQELEYYSMKLASTMYFVGQGQESLGIREDVAKAIKLEKFNSCVTSQVTGTIRDKESRADLDSQYESVTHSVYARAYRLIKQKMESGSELLASIKKVINRQLLEMQLSGFTGTGVITEPPKSFNNHGIMDVPYNPNQTGFAPKGRYSV